MSSVYDQLLEMGFTKQKAEKALKFSGEKGLEAAMEWIIDHEADEDTDSEDIAKPANCTDDSILSANFFKCEDCNKVLRNNEEVQLHSARTGHVNYAESTDDARPLSEEERKQQLEKLQELLKQKQVQREEQEKKEELEREKQRRRQGRTLASAKAKFEEDEIRRLVEQKKREKDEDRAYREKLKADIAREREEKRARDRGQLSEATIAPVSNEPLVPFTSSKTESTICRLQIRLPSGSPLKAEFKQSEPLSTVIYYLTQHWPGESTEISPNDIQLLTNFPTREFSEIHMSTSLFDLGLCPSAVLIARLITQPGLTM